ncbi:MAG: PLD nuclease N-terminal domain-containing protein [Lysinibacillus sp.]
MENINLALLAPLFIIQLILMVVALLDLRKVHATNGPKWMWVLIIVFVSTLGPIIYFVVGRKN